jgi:hypothetical protein
MLNILLLIGKVIRVVELELEIEQVPERILSLSQLID